MTEDQIRALAYHLTDVMADRWHVNRCGTDQADDVTCVEAFLRGRLTVQIPEDQIMELIAQWRAEADVAKHSVDDYYVGERRGVSRCADELEALLADHYWHEVPGEQQKTLSIERPQPQEAQLRHLASAMRKVLPPELLAEVIAHLDPLTPFVEFLSKPLGSPTP